LGHIGGFLKSIFHSRWINHDLFTSPAEMKKRMRNCPVSADYVAVLVESVPELGIVAYDPFHPNGSSCRGSTVTVDGVTCSVIHWEENLNPRIEVFERVIDWGKEDERHRREEQQQVIAKVPERRLLRGERFSVDPRAEAVAVRPAAFERMTAKERAAQIQG
jgi:hypothetical protein